MYELNWQSQLPNWLCARNKATTMITNKSASALAASPLTWAPRSRWGEWMHHINTHTHARRSKNKTMKRCSGEGGARVAGGCVVGVYLPKCIKCWNCRCCRCLPASLRSICAGLCVAIMEQLECSNTNLYTHMHMRAHVCAIACMRAPSNSLFGISFKRYLLLVSIGSWLCFRICAQSNQRIN